MIRLALGSGPWERAEKRLGVDKSMQVRASRWPNETQVEHNLKSLRRLSLGLTFPQLPDKQMIRQTNVSIPSLTFNRIKHVHRLNFCATESDFLTNQKRRVFPKRSARVSNKAEFVFVTFIWNEEANMPGRGNQGLRREPRIRFRHHYIQRLTKPAVRRLARLGGVKRISGVIYHRSSRSG